MTADEDDAGSACRTSSWAGPDLTSAGVGDSRRGRSSQDSRSVGDRTSSATGRPCGQAASAAARSARGEVAGLGREGLVELAGLLALAVDLVVAEVAEHGGDGDALGGGLAEVAAAVAVEVRGRLAVLFQEPRLASRSAARGSAAMFSRSWSRLVISLTTTWIRSSAKTVLIAACSFLKPLSHELVELGRRRRPP